MTTSGVTGEVFFPEKPRKISWIFITAAVLLTVSIGFGSLIGTQIIAANRVALMHKTALEKIAALLSQLMDAETGERGYILTHAPEFLTPYTSAKREIPAILDDLEVRAHAGELPPAGVNQARELTQQKLAIAADLVALEAGGYANDAATLALLKRGKRVMDELRQCLALMQLETEQRFETSLRTSTQFTQVRTGGWIATVVVNLAFLAWMYRRMREEIGGREQAMREALQQKEFIRVTLASIGDAVIVTDAAGNISFMNEEALRLTRWTLAEAQGLPLTTVYKLINEASRLAVPSPVSEILDLGTTYELSGNTSLVSKDGTETPIEDSAAPIRQDGSHIDGMVLVFRDASAKRVEDQKLNLAKSEAEQANQTKSSFLANMSHEIRTPLGAILGFSELLTDPTVSRSDKVNFSAAIKRNGDLLKNIVNDILDLSSVEAGKLTINKEVVPVSDVLADVNSLLRLQANDKGIALELRQDGSLPEFIYTDPLRLRQLLLNVVGNAIKFTEHGSVQVTLKVQPAADGRELLSFSVTDTGCGIESAAAQKLFKPFSQADASINRKFGGTGLGLVLAKRLAQLLGGDLTLTVSTPGVGSTFSFSIDPGKVAGAFAAQAKLAAKAAGAAEAICGAPSAPTSLHAAKILLVEDAADNRILVGRYLRDAGAQVDSAHNGSEAIEKVHQGNYDLLLMDLQMPVMGGYESVSRLRAEGFTKPVIALTAHTMASERDRCLASGFNGHLGKPINRHLLIEVVAHFLQA